jgi:hypothetical protein
MAIVPSLFFSWLSASFLILAHAGFETTALDHEAVDDTVKNGAVVVAVTHVLCEVGAGFRRPFLIQRNDD